MLRKYFGITRRLHNNDNRSIERDKTKNKTPSEYQTRVVVDVIGTTAGIYTHCGSRRCSCSI